MSVVRAQVHDCVDLAMTHGDRLSHPNQECQGHCENTSRSCHLAKRAPWLCYRHDKSICTHPGAQDCSHRQCLTAGRLVPRYSTDLQRQMAGSLICSRLMAAIHKPGQSLPTMVGQKDPTWKRGLAVILWNGRQGLAASAAATAPGAPPSPPASGCCWLCLLTVFISISCLLGDTKPFSLMMTGLMRMQWGNLGHRCVPCGLPAWPPCCLHQHLLPAASQKGPS